MLEHIIYKHQEHLMMRPQVGLEEPDPQLFWQWSEHLALFLEKSPYTLNVELYRLYNAYKNETLRDCLKVIEGFSLFPGYPFMVKGSFVEHINYICNNLNKLTKNINIPKTPLISYRRAASSYISVVMSHLFDVLPTMISFRHLIAMSSWLNAFAKWGGVIHDHFYPNEENLTLLRAAQIKKCIIHRRHPADVLVSFAYKNLANNSGADNCASIHEVIDRQMEFVIPSYGKWSRLWHKEAARGEIEILETQYEDMKQDQLLFFKRILSFSDAIYDEAHLMNVLDKFKPTNDGNSYNFRKGMVNDWTEVLSSKQVNKVKKLIDAEFPNMYF